MCYLRYTCAVAALAFGLWQNMAQAAVSTFTDFGSCNLDLDYGSTGAATINGYYAVPPLDPEPASNVSAATGLTFFCNTSGEATGTLEVTYSLANFTPDPAGSFSFLFSVDPNGDLVNFSDTPTVNFAPAGIGEPNAFEIDDVFSGYFAQHLVLSGQFDSQNQCGAFCDVEMGLQWDFAGLQPGEVAEVRVAVSDTGQLIAQTFLAATRVNGAGVVINPAQTLTISGIGTIRTAAVPVPAALPLFASALGIFSLIARRRK